ncbi:MAG: ABC-F family ATP-binding cassette domain-containing protein [Planctomycetes bacterium]|nr:ABC-F family ATP-binding cassette domain-containing protein [Planctomycetota bacterium]
MPVISLIDVHKCFGSEIVFEGVSARFFAGEKVGLVGNNGSGKTTIFRLILGEIDADVGEVRVRKGLRIGYLAQEAVFDGTRTVVEEMHAGLEDLFAIQERMEDISKRLGVLSGDALEGAMKEYDRLSHAFEISGGFTYEAKTKSILAGLGFGEEHFDLKTSALSGGQLSRLGLGQVLLADTDVLLLDEPTNHLDLQAVEWLEGFLRNYDGAVIAISHDRYLLDSVAGKIAEVENGKVTVWKGNYSEYVKNKEVARIEAERNYRKQKEYVERTEDFIKRNINLKGMQGAARGRRKHLERKLKEEGRPELQGQARNISFSFAESDSRSDIVLRCEKLEKSYGDLVLFKDLTFDLLCGERLGITGPNGTGKSTFLKMALGIIGDFGGIIRLGSSLKVGYLDQHGEELDVDKCVLDEARSVCPELSEEAIRGRLGAFLFSGDDVFKRVGDLSGGQQNRLMLCKLVLAEPDVLVLDEPTNHLDIAGKEVLESALKGFNGGIIVVSHDRFFLDRVVNKLLVVGVNSLGKRVFGECEMVDAEEKAYSRYHEMVVERNTAVEDACFKKSGGRKAKRSRSAAGAKKEVSSEIRQYNKYSIDQIEDMIMELEDAIPAMEAGFADENVYKDHEKMAELHEKINAEKKRLELLYEVYEHKHG